MQRRSFLKTSSMASVAMAGTRGWAALNRKARIAYGGIGIECSTYSHIRARMEDFTILRGEEASRNERFKFLNRFFHRSHFTVKSFVS